MIDTPPIEWTAAGLLIFLFLKCLPGIIRNLREDKQGTLEVLTTLVDTRSKACQEKLDAIIAAQKTELKLLIEWQKEEQTAFRETFETTLRQILSLVPPGTDSTPEPKETS